MAKNRLAHRSHVENWFEEFERSFESTQDEMRRNRQSSHQAESVVRVPPATAFRRELESKPILGDPIGGVGDGEDAVRVFHVRKRRWNAAFVVVALFVAILVGVGVGMIPGGSPSRLSVDELRRLLLPDAQELSASQSKALSWLVDEDEARSDQDTDVLKERFALVSLYFATGGDKWTEQLNFLNTSTSVCAWNSLGKTGDPSAATGQPGAYCQDESVSHLFLTDNNLQGTIPKDLGFLTGVKGLYLSENGLAGKLPSEIGRMRSLHTIWIKQNTLTGTIPSEITGLPYLEKLYLYGNDLGGPIPKQMSASLAELVLERNELSGTIPHEWGDLSDLQRLSLFSNEMAGSIPSSFGNLKKLKQLRLSSNVLTGSIPSELFTISGLTVLDVQHNNIRGDLNAVFCTRNQTSLTVTADCAGNSPKVQCDCCTCS